MASTAGPVTGVAAALNPDVPPPGAFSNSNLPVNTPMLRHHLSPDEKEAIDVNRRREYEAERKKRIFDPKIRTIGIDKEALDRQVAEKQARKEKERDEERLYAQQTLYYDAVLKRQEIEKRRLKRQVEEEGKTFSLTQLRREQRREYDLDDKDRVKKYHEPPEEKYGASSVQVLAGEDRAAAERKKLQQKQVRDWVAQQKFEKEIIKKAEQDEDKEWGVQAIKTAELMYAVEDQQKAARRQLQCETSEANKQTALCRLEETLKGRLTRQDDDNKELINQYTDPYLADGRLDLTGHVNVNDGPGDTNPAGLEPGDAAVIGTLRDGFKGTTRKQRQSCLEENLRMWREKEEQKQREMDEELQWARQHEANRKLQVAVEREKQRLAQRVRYDVRHTNAGLGKQQQDTQTYLKKELYTNPPSEDYFNYFGTTTR
ncbi:unnamed protein product [Vitrella brassicaformis CCMP3155]|uniref:RIB43A-like with coiled-coils protein 2 n=2 Tax=Vitrella brassicaformis TaxID=1169539 RepID=A0A0G4FXA6_VITBC|nr:unnamed protein product [Vitrella brassicaformis CCMP3155]|eukprot:CEM19482.1 unnamed protein product [Vitrella brassicaformis CCMP3155]